MNRYFKYCFILLFSCLLLACQVKVPYGSIKVEIKSSSARAIGPVSGPEPDSFKVELSSGITNAVIKRVTINPDSSFVVFSDLVPGTYTVAATGYSGSRPVSFSRASVSVKEGATETVSLTPEPSDTSQSPENPLYGQVSIPVSWKTDTDIDSIILVDADKKEIASMDIEKGKREATFSAEMKVGIKKVRLRLMKEQEVLFESDEEELTVYSGSVSSPADNEKYCNLIFAKTNPATAFSALRPEKNNELTFTFTLPETVDDLKSATLKLSDGNSRTLLSDSLECYKGKSVIITFNSLIGGTDYTASLSFTKKDGTVTLPLFATGRTLIDARSLDIYADNTTPSIGDEITFQALVTPLDATDLGGSWHSSDESIIKIGTDGKAVALSEGKALVTYILNNKGLTESLELTVSSPSSEVNSVRTAEGAAITWTQVKNATGYMVEYAFGDEEYTLLKTSDETSAMHTFTPVTGSKLTYRIRALFFNGESSAIVGTSFIRLDADDPVIGIEKPILPASSLITISGIENGEILDFDESRSLTASTTEQGAAIIWYINGMMASEGESLTLSRLSPGIDYLSTENGSQTLMVIIRTPDKVLSRSLTFCLMTAQYDNNNHDKGGI